MKVVIVLAPEVVVVLYVEVMEPGVQLISVVVKSYVAVSSASGLQVVMALNWEEVMVVKQDTAVYAVDV